MTNEDLENVSSRPMNRISRLAAALGDKGFRHSYMARQLKAFLAQQIRALRGDMRQQEFGELIGKPQSVVSRLEKQADRHISIQTLIEIAEILDIAIIIRFVDFPTFLRYTEDYSNAALTPARYDQSAVDALARESQRSSYASALDAFLSSASQQTQGPSVQNYAELPRMRHGGIATLPTPLPANDLGSLAQLREPGGGRFSMGVTAMHARDQAEAVA